MNDIPRPSGATLRRAGAAAAVAVMLAAALTDYDRTRHDDTPRTGVVDTGPADGIRMPDGYSTADTKCFHGDRVYARYHGETRYDDNVLVPADPTCKGQ